MQLNFLKKAAVLSLGLVSLVSCGSTASSASSSGDGYSETDFATFKTKATEALKSETAYTSCKIVEAVKYNSNGTIQEEEMTVEANMSGRTFVAKADANSDAAELVYTINGFSLSTLIETDTSSNITYKFYTSNVGFRCEGLIESNTTVSGASNYLKSTNTIEYDIDGYITSYAVNYENKVTYNSATTVTSGTATLSFTYTK